MTASGAATRARYDDALDQVLAVVRRLDGEVDLDVQACGGRVLRRPIIADRDQPPFDRATMDGYALRVADLVPGRPMPVAGTVAAGSAWSRDLPAGSCVVIATGAPVPGGLDTVIEHERSDRGSPVTFSSAVERGASIHPRGVDARAGEILVEPGTLLRPQHLGMAAAVGMVTLSVAPRPRVALITSGDEVVSAAERVEPWQVRNSNAPMLLALLPRFGAEVAWCAHVPDDEDATMAAVRHAFGVADIVVTVGGISAGERDWFPRVLAGLGARAVLRGAAIQPGGPVAASVMGDAPLTLGLPGNPVSVLACAHLFLWPCVRAAAGCRAPLPWRAAPLGHDVMPHPVRAAFRPGRIDGDGRAVVLPWAGSGDLASTADAEVLIRLPAQRERVQAGSMCPILPLP